MTQAQNDKTVKTQMLKDLGFPESQPIGPRPEFNPGEIARRAQKAADDARKAYDREIDEAQQAYDEAIRIGALREAYVDALMAAAKGNPGDTSLAANVRKARESLAAVSYASTPEGQKAIREFSGKINQHVMNGEYESAAELRDEIQRTGKRRLLPPDFDEQAEVRFIAGLRRQLQQGSAAPNR